jgi:hypothetical protein
VNGAVVCSRTHSRVTSSSATSTNTSLLSRTRKVAASVTTTSTARCVRSPFSICSATESSDPRFE